jgi:hypothetical protein
VLLQQLLGKHAYLLSGVVDVLVEQIEASTSVLPPWQYQIMCGALTWEAWNGALISAPDEEG